MKYLAVSLVLLVLFGGFFIFSSNKNNDSEQSASSSIESQDMVSNQSESESQQTNAAVESASYIDYSQEAVTQNADKEVVIFFHAAWCPNCRALEETLTSNDIPGNIVILKADYDDEVELKQKYGVTQQTTMVHVDENGETINLWVATAYDDIEDIKAKL